MSRRTHSSTLFPYTTLFRSKRLTQLTRVNDSLFAKRQLVTPEDFWYTSFDGTKIETWIMKPVGFAPGRKYPLILKDRKSTRLNSSHVASSYAVFCLKKKRNARNYCKSFRATPAPRASPPFTSPCASAAYEQMNDTKVLHLHNAHAQVKSQSYVTIAK